MNAGLVASHDLVVSLDYGQFYLHTSVVDYDALPGLVDQALNGDGIVQDSSTLIVIVPHQNNFEMPLRVEVWTERPIEDLDEWQEAFEAHLEVAGEGLVYESPTLDIVPIEVPPGRYRALITGRGIVTAGWPGSTTPGDDWRIQLWPSVESISPIRLKAFQPQETPGDVISPSMVEDGIDRPWLRLPPGDMSFEGPVWKGLFDRWLLLPDYLPGLGALGRSQEEGLELFELGHNLRQGIGAILQPGDTPQSWPVDLLRTGSATLSNLTPSQSDAVAEQVRELVSLAQDTLVWAHAQQRPGK